MTIQHWEGKRVLVTGAGGFIGSHLAERLVAEGASVRALVHYNALGSRGWLDASSMAGDMEIVAGDITDRHSVERVSEGVEVIFHLAALIGIPYSYEAPFSYLRTNVEGTMNVLEIARVGGIERVVHTSTSEVYGSAQSVPIREVHPLRGQSPYSASKIAADQMALAYHCSFGVPVAIARPFNTFGPRQSARGIVPTVIAQCLSSAQSIRLGSTETMRDMNFVSNTVDGFLAIASSAQAEGEVFNLGSGSEVSIGELARKIAQLAGVPDLPIEVDSERIRPGKSEVQRLLADNTQARLITGWEPRMILEEGLEHTIAWMRDNMEKYRPAEYVV